MKTGMLKKWEMKEKLIAKKIISIYLWITSHTL
jgi:hypothetical protein